MPIGGVPLRKLKLGQGVRGGLGSLPSDKASQRGLPSPLPNIPHIHAPQMPKINYGAVAQVGQQEHQQKQPGMFSGLASGLGQLPIALGQDIKPKMFKLNGTDKKALKLLKNPNNWQTKATPHIRQAIMNPSPKLAMHIQADPALKQSHQLLKSQIMAMDSAPSVGQATPSQQIDMQTQAQEQAQHPVVAGLPTPQMGGLAGWGQKLVTGIGQTAIGVGPGLYHLAGGEIHRPIPTTKAFGAALGHSFGQTLHNPLGQLENDPVSFIMNVLTPVSFGAGAAARVAEAGKIADAVKAGEMTRAEAAAALTKTMMRPQPMQRSIALGKGDNALRVSPPAFKSALGGYLQTKLLDPLTEKAIQSGKMSALNKKWVALGREFKAPSVAEGIGPAGKVGKLVRKDFEQQMQMRRGLEETKMKRFMGPQNEPSTQLYHGGPKGLEGGALSTGKGKGLRDFFGGNGLYSTTSPDVANVYSKFHGEGAVHNLTVAKSAIADAEKPMTPEMHAALEPIIGKQPEGTTLKDVFTKIRNQPSEALNKLLKPVEVPKKIDPRQVQKALSAIGIHGVSYKALTTPADIRNIFTALGHRIGEAASPSITVTPEATKLLNGDTLWNMVDDHGNLDHLEDLLMHLGRSANPEDPPAMFGGMSGELSHIRVANPQAFASRLGGVFEYLRSIAQTPAELNHIDSVEKAVHEALDTPITHGEFKRLAGPPQTMVSDVLDTTDQLLGEKSLRGEPSAPQEGIGREHPGKVWQDIANRLSPTERAHTPLGASEANQAVKEATKSREHLIWDLKKAQEIRKTPGLAASEAQRLAYARGAAKAHLDLWHSLWHGGAGGDESFVHDPAGYVGIRKPPEGVKSKAYSSEAGIGRQFRSMVETDPKKLAAAPGDYKFIPKGTWRRMKLYEPGTGSAAKALDMIDRGTQMIRIGRFLHPGYVEWALQNGILHLSQAGMFAFRNAFQLRNQYPRLTEAEKAVFDNAVGAGHFGGGIARASQGSESSKFAGTAQKLGSFWHKVDDRYWRQMSLIHELNHAGYHDAEDWASLMKHDPKKFRSIAMKAQDQAINYSEMSPAERATLQKVFTAYGWTRGASTYTMRFPFEHPLQARLLGEVGQEGKKQVENFYAGLNGMVPNWLRGYLPIGHSNSPLLLSSGILNPGETFGNVLSEVPGLEKGQTENLSQEEAPVPAALQEAMTGMTRYGKQLTGDARIKQPISDMLHRFIPFSVLQNLTQSKGGGGTMKQGPVSALEQFMGAPVSQLNNAKETAALGMKDYEQSLSRHDEINFRYHLSINNLPKEAAAYKAQTGQNPSPALMGKLKGDLEAVRQRDQFMLSYAHGHGSNAYRSLPAKNKVMAAVAFMSQHKYIHPQEANQILMLANTLKDDTQLEGLASELWSDTGIGAVATAWKSAMSELKPSTLTPQRGGAPNIPLPNLPGGAAWKKASKLSKKKKP